MANTLKYTEFRYDTANYLQNLAVWEFKNAPPSPSGNGPKYWFIYIHGGAWRDPRCLMDTAIPTINRLLEPGSPVSPSRIAGFASLNYRLSPHPAFPQDDSTAEYDLRAARHPDHIRDVYAGLKLLQERFDIGSNYVLVGHSAGAFLAFQLLMGPAALDGVKPRSVALPVCIVGVEGIYDLRGMNERAGGGYRELIDGAFGADMEGWDAASPGLFQGLKEGWGSAGRLAVLAHSPEDELVDGGEIDTMEKRLAEEKVRLLAYRDLKGEHDEVREDGFYVARVLGQALADLDKHESEK